MTRALLCTACLSVVTCQQHDWHQRMIDHILDAGHEHPRLVGCVDVDAAFWGMVRHYYGLCRR